MSDTATDTHAIVWFLEDSPRLSRTAIAALEDTAARGDAIIVPSMVIVEITYLIEKGRLRADTLTRLRDALGDPDGALTLVPLDRAVADAVGRVPRHLVPDLPDRVIAATALHLGLPLVTCDPQIRASGIPTIW